MKEFRTAFKEEGVGEKRGPVPIGTVQLHTNCETRNTYIQILDRDRVEAAVTGDKERHDTASRILPITGLEE